VENESGLNAFLALLVEDVAPEEAGALGDPDGDARVNLEG